jgi:hypothetical protein
MSSPIRRCALPLFVGVVALLLSTGEANAQRQRSTQQSTLGQQLSSLLSQLNTAQQQITALQQQLGSATGNQQAINNLLQQLRTMQQTITAWQKQLTTFQQQLNAVSGQAQQSSGGTSGQQQGNGQCQGQGQSSTQSTTAQLNSLARQLKSFQTQNSQQSSRILRSLLGAGQQASTMQLTPQTSTQAQQISRQGFVLRRLRR